MQNPESYYSLKQAQKTQKRSKKGDISDSSTSSVKSAFQISSKYAQKPIKSPRPTKQSLHATPGKLASSGKKRINAPKLDEKAIASMTRDLSRKFGNPSAFPQ